MNTVVIAGASGLVGQAAVQHFASLEGWEVVALSRRRPANCPAQVKHHPLDLTDSEACSQLAPELRPVTHVIYSAVAEQPGLVAGWHNQQQMQLNLSMLQNLLQPLLPQAHDLQHVTLLQGAKAYGAHTGHLPPIPARESDPRVVHSNFYWLQEDCIKELAKTHGFHWTIFRPQVIIGAATGVAMNPLLPLAAYAAMRKAQQLPFSFPGGVAQPSELTDTGLLARAMAWAATSPAARDEVFNITNGDLFCWRDGWATLANAFGVVAGDAEPLQLSRYLEDNHALWDAAVAEHRLQPLSLNEFLGQSHHYIDLLLRRDATTITHPTLLSTIKLRQAGFSECVDSYHSLTYWVEQLQRQRLIPG